MQTARIRAQGRAFAHIAAFHPELTAFRRDLHAHPELGFEERYTSARVVESLKVCGVDEIHTGIGQDRCGGGDSRPAPERPPAAWWACAPTWTRCP